MIEDKRHLHVDIVHGERKRPRGVAEQTMVAIRRALVRGVDDQGVFRQSHLLQGLGHLADAIVHHGGLGGDVDHRHLVVKRFYGRPGGGPLLEHQLGGRPYSLPSRPVFQVGMNFLLGHGGRALAIISRVPVARLHGHCGRQVVRAVVGKVEKKRLPLFLLRQKMRRFFSPEISEVFADLVFAAVVYDPLIIEGGRMPGRESHPVLKTQLRPLRHAQVVFSHQARVVARLGQGLRERAKLFQA